MNKPCFKCGKVLPLENFYRHPKMGDGHLGKCKDCTKLDAKTHYALKCQDKAFVWQERARGREKAKRLGYVSCKKYKPRNHKQLSQMFARNKVARELDPCEAGFHYHHWSYQKQDAIDVFKLTVQDHMRVHRYMVYDEDQLRYRRLDGMLLDTRDASQRYYDYVLSLSDGEYPRNPPL